MDFVCFAGFNSWFNSIQFVDDLLLFLKKHSSCVDKGVQASWNGSTAWLAKASHNEGPPTWAKQRQMPSWAGRTWTSTRRKHILLEPGPGIVPDKLAPNPSFAQSSLPGQYHPAANPRPESYRLSAKGAVTSAPCMGSQPWSQNGQLLAIERHGD